jgi:hypothetical protein
MKYKSKLEESVAAALGSKATYEPDRLYFIQPEKKRFYLPDFKIGDKVYIEAKGKWDASDRAKHVWIKEQHPDVTIYLLFQNSSVKLNKRSKTTYGDWATKNGLKWADYRQGIPPEWLLPYESKETTGKSRRTSRSHSRSKGR